LILGGTLSLQQQAPPVIRTETNLVRLDVSVLDRNRRPVRGLAASDFEVLEDGRPQKVLTAIEVNVSEAPKPTAPWIVEAGHDVASNSVSDRRLLVLVFDLLTEGEAFEARTAREIGHSLVDALGPEDLMAVVFTSDNRGAQDFTADRALLRQAIDRTGMWAIRPFDSDFDISAPGERAQPSRVAPRPNADYGPCFGTRSMLMLRHLGEALRDVPDRRKAIMYVSAGVPFNPLALSPGQSDPMGCNAQFKVQFDEVLQQFQLANINVYPVSVSGLRVRLPVGQSSIAPDLPTDFMLMFASNTGGRATVNNNRPSRDAVDRIMTENGSYYIIGYELPPRRRASENWRRIEVRVNRRGVDVRARSRFIDAPIQARPSISALRDAITGVMPKQGLPLRVVVAPLALDAEPGGSVVAVSVGVSDRNAQPDLNDVELLVAAFDAEGRERETIHSKGAVTLRPGVEEGAEFELHAGIPLRPGNYQLRVGVRNNRSGSTGSVYTTVDVPQFFKSSLSLSGLVVSASPAVPANRSEELGRQLPVVPTTRRIFSPADRVSVFARLYQPVTEPRTINVVATVVDARNASVFRRELNVSGKDFVRGAADLHLDVPVSFAPGQYLFALEIQDPKGNIRRTMRFTIR
jgi:VWFA-related protein